MEIARHFGCLRFNYNIAVNFLLLHIGWEWCGSKWTDLLILFCTLSRSFSFIGMIFFWSENLCLLMTVSFFVTWFIFLVFHSIAWMLSFSPSFACYLNQQEWWLFPHSRINIFVATFINFTKHAVLSDIAVTLNTVYSYLCVIV